MPCMTQSNLTQTELQVRKSAVDRLRAAIAAGDVSVVIGRDGAIALKGWTDRRGVSDICAYRILSNTPEMRKAIARAQVTSGNTLNPQAIASGMHSHDGGATWGRH